jgi:hypothetical protein
MTQMITISSETGRYMLDATSGEGQKHSIQRRGADKLVQLADLRAGAIVRSFNNGRSGRNRWRNGLGKTVDHVGNFPQLIQRSE